MSKAVVNEEDEFWIELAKRSARALARAALRGDELAIQELKRYRNVALRFVDEVPELKKAVEIGLI